tara:strand:+ start:219 stop:431 length:213 start_codon:yes stop_codon:yes gene_type:complete
MMWLDYTIDQAGKNFRVKGDWEGEVMGKQKDGSLKDYHLYKPHDVFVVNEDGWLVHVGKDGDVLTKKYIK